MKPQPTKSAFILLVLLLLGLFPAGQTVWADSRGVAANSGITKSNRRVALVIGNAAYEKGRLKNPVNDARLVAQTLQRVGFEVIKGENLTQKQMKRAIDRFGRLLRGGQVGLFFYAGHGIQVEGKNWLIPIGANLQGRADVEYEAVRAGRVLAKMQNAGSRLNIVLLDACRNNPFARGFRGPTSQGLAYMDAPSGSLIAYATAPGQTAADGDGRNSPFTKALVRHLTLPGLSVDSILKKTGAEVNKKTRGRQQPWVASSFYGEYFLRPGKSGQKSHQPRQETTPEITPPPRAQIPQVLFAEDFIENYDWPIKDDQTIQGDPPYNDWKIRTGCTYKKGLMYARFRDGLYEICRKKSKGVCCAVKLKRDLDIKVSKDTFLRFRVRPIYSNVRNGAGDKNREYPASLLLVADSPKGLVNLFFSFNYRGGKSHELQDNNKQYYKYIVQSNISEGVWIEKKIRIMEYLGRGCHIRKIVLLNNGWDFEAEWDYVGLEKGETNSDAYKNYTLEQLVEEWLGKTDYEKRIIMEAVKKSRKYEFANIVDLAHHFSNTRKFKRAIATYEIALEYKNNQAIHYELGRLFQIIGNKIKAKKYLKYAMRNGGYIANQAGRILSRLED